MLKKYQEYNPKPTTKQELKMVLHEIWDSLPQVPIQKAMLSFRKRLQLCIQSIGGHFEHLLSYIMHIRPFSYKQPFSGIKIELNFKI